MPQLAPLNWVFLMLLFWFMVISVSMMLWWTKSKKFNVNISTFKKMNKSQWTW
uniref:ATP synthase F0 subunit 8 n=1 Tax=Chiton albolineatus TaxID=2719130 RepID=A0A6H1PG78_9MOLL|nr:ATP synthase F0 subunit 8 [Chiton albolineatus]QIZ12636.1 ATP synthase F0 subunit 8 [Chiton albolineatus]